MSEEQDWRARLNGRRVVASISGGKDSAALGLWLLEQGIEHERVFCDTDWEHPDTYAYLRGPLTEKLGPIRELQSAGMVAGIRAHGMFPSRGRKWCTDELKLAPFRAYLGTLDDDVVNATGVRAEESDKRAALPAWEWSEGLDCESWRPLLSWSFAEVVAIHRRHGLAPNPLYLRGAERVGCWPCINSKKAEIKLLAETDPARVAEVAALEAEISERRGAPRAFFNGKTGRGTVAPIADVAAWATGRGQLVILPADESPGCWRWGLCERPSQAGTGEA
jgi:3'-phosphoadenosine 5'-phosphosulfate sulfotransferase (PAPS reductase)/FAD synthetase